MIRNPRERTPRDSIERQEQDARTVVQYCENDSDCRRVLLLQFFGEKFDKQKCHNHCDNCRNGSVMVDQDVTKEAKAAIALVRSFNESGENVTSDHCRLVFKGSKSSAVRERGHDQRPSYGAGSDLPPELVEQLFAKLLYMDAFEEVSIQNQAGWHNQYLKASRPLS